MGVQARFLVWPVMKFTIERFRSQVQFVVGRSTLKASCAQAMFNAKSSRENPKRFGQRHGSPIGVEEMTPHSDLRLAEKPRQIRNCRDKVVTGVNIAE